MPGGAQRCDQAIFGRYTHEQAWLASLRKKEGELSIRRGEASSTVERQSLLARSARAGGVQ
jgi:hypothetical protein